MVFTVQEEVIVQLLNNICHISYDVRSDIERILLILLFVLPIIMFIQLDVLWNTDSWNNTNFTEVSSYQNIAAGSRQKIAVVKQTEIALIEQLAWDPAFCLQLDIYPSNLIK